MNGRTSKGRVPIAALAAGAACLLALPALSNGEGLVSGAGGALGQSVDDAAGGVSSLGSGATGGSGPAPAAPAPPAPSGGTYATPAANQPPGYQPPLHGEAPHGQGTVGTLDVAPDPARPLTGETDGSESGEDAVVGRSRGEQNEDGSYSGKVEVLALGGESVIAPTETEEGETEDDALLELGCGAEPFCLELVETRSSTDGNGSENSFSTAFAEVGGADGISASAAESEGSIEEDSSCQRSEGSSSVASADAGGAEVARALQSSTSSEACNDGSSSQENDSRVLLLLGAPVPVPAEGCATGEPDTAVAVLPGFLAFACNADDTNGAGEDSAQTTSPYGVREALATFLTVPVGDQELVKVTGAASESAAVAPGEDGPGGPPDDSEPDDPRPPIEVESGPPDGPGGPNGPDGPGDGGSGSGDGAGGDDQAQCEDGTDNDGDGLVDFPDDPDCESPGDDSEADALPFTGANLVGFGAIGALLVAGGALLGRPREQV